MDVNTNTQPTEAPVVDVDAILGHRPSLGELAELGPSVLADLLQRALVTGGQVPIAAFQSSLTLDEMD